MANILIADSYVIIGLICREILEQAGHRVFTAASANEAIDISTSSDIDIAIVDEMLPGFPPDYLLGVLKSIRPNIRSMLSVFESDPIRSDTRLWNVLIVKNDYFLLLLEKEVANILAERDRQRSRALKYMESADAAASGKESRV